MENKRKKPAHLLPLKTIFLLSITFLSACNTISAKDVKPVTDDSADYMAHPEELELMEESERLHEQMVRKGLIYRNNEIAAYIEDLAERIQTDEVKAKLNLHFYVTRDPSINAFALPNGNIYLNIGLMNKLETEAQLAFVMAHEAAHVVQRHSFKTTLNLQSNVIGAHVADLFLAGTGLSYLAAVTNIANYSREMETEADEKALVYLSGSTQYNLDSAIHTFEQLKEVKHSKDRASIWASHPDNAARYNHAMAFITANQLQLDAEAVSSSQFESIKDLLTESTVKMRLRFRQYQLAEEVCLSAIEKNGDSALMLSYVGDSYRLRGTHIKAAAQEYAWLYDKKLRDVEPLFADKKQENLEKSKQYYEQALVLQGHYPKAQRGMGLTLAESGDFAAAKDYLNQYIENENIKDRRYVMSVLKEIEKNSIK
ncbi:Putative Zn-dependent protease, contains TPR repeats [Alteromonadaceae bacterium Bs31]|nr:Putative Zn-dependent protease, contains TPR repeats [Alteromonadaceae bacterium Bs31]